MAGALSGLRVVELDADGSGALAGKLMANQGADVIKVEPPAGDPMRHAGPFVGDEPHPDRSLSFWNHNTGKRSVTLAIEEPSGREALRSLIEGADVLLETLPPGRLEALELGPEVLTALNPRLVITRMTPYGQDGPRRDWLGTDLTLLAAGGELYICGYDDHALPPVRPAGDHAWQLGAHYALIGTLMALLERDQSGLGQVVDVSIQDAVAASLEMVTPLYFLHGQVPERQESRYAAPRPTAPTVTPAADGRWVSFFLTPNRRSWTMLVEWMARTGHDAFLAEEKYLSYQQRHHDKDAIHAVIAEFVGSMSAEEVYVGAQACGLPWGIVQSPDEAVEDMHFRARGSLVPVEHPELGRSFDYPGAPAIFSGTPFAIRRRPPLLGEHTDTVLREHGHSTAEIARLRERGVV